MDSATIFAFLAFLLVIALIMSRQEAIVIERDNSWWPATWNYDWRGGPGYDRHMIRRDERHRSYGPPHSTPGGDGCSRH